jgi:hypothetical protein
MLNMYEKRSWLREQRRKGNAKEKEKSEKNQTWKEEDERK